MAVLFDLDKVKSMKKEGKSEKDIAKFFEFDSIQKLRVAVSMATLDKRKDIIRKSMELVRQNWSYAAIAKFLGTDENIIRMAVFEGTKREQNK